MKAIAKPITKGEVPKKATEVTAKTAPRRFPKQDFLVELGDY